MLSRLKQWAGSLKRELAVVLIAAKDNRTPKLAKWTALATAAYALSPIDLIPDFIPVLGYLDDLIIVPIGIGLTIKLIPQSLLAQFREAAVNLPARQANWVAAGIIIGIWILASVAIFMFVSGNV